MGCSFHLGINHNFVVKSAWYSEIGIAAVAAVAEVVVELLPEQGLSWKYLLVVIVIVLALVSVIDQMTIWPTWYLV